MHNLQSILTQAATSATTAAKSSKSSSSSYVFLVIIVLFGAVYFFFLRPRQQRMRQQQRAGREIAIGDPVMSAGGIYGTVVGLGTDDLDVEVSPGVVLTFTRRAISLRPGGQAEPSSATGGTYQIRTSRTRIRRFRRVDESDEVGRVGRR